MTASAEDVREQTETRVSNAAVGTDPFNAGFYHESTAAFDRATKQVNFIAYYLPQFHPCEENDMAWGKGFTEWTNVTKAKQRFAGHVQPNLPADLGFYDLRSAQTLRAQCSMATGAGIDAFCFHHYWFSGHAVLDTPLKMLVDDKTIDIKFFINWANENWTRRWDGGDGEVILRQGYLPDDPSRLVNSLLYALSDERYMKINDRRLLMIYRPSIIPDAGRFIANIRKAFEENGLGNPMIMASDADYSPDLGELGLDAIAAFPPHRHWLLPDNGLDASLYHGDFHGHVKSYDAMAEEAIRISEQRAPYFRGVTPRWDNTPRRAVDGTVFLGSTPQKYESWLTETAQLAMREHPENARLVFINAWNEWAEGAYLEPDRHFGWAYLNATARVASKMSGPGSRSSIVGGLDFGPEADWKPARLVPYYHWSGHIPFVFWLMSRLKPKTVVELGTHSGNSFFAMCQAASLMGLDCKLYAVDSWAGDIHMTVDEAVFQDVQAYGRARYSTMIELVKSTFDAARERFGDRSVDLLHIDGTHTYDAVRNDFERWVPTVRDGGVILFHDIAERRADFGVFRLWAELKKEFRSFEFHHSHGLGVLAIGKENSSIAPLFDIGSDDASASRVRRYFELKAASLPNE